MFGVVPKDFIVLINPQTGKQEVKQRPNWYPETTVNLKDISAFTGNCLLMRFEFYRKLGVPYEELDAVPDEYLVAFNSRRPGPENLGVRWQEGYQTLFHPDSSDQTANIQRSMKARRDVLMEDIKSLYKSVKNVD